MQLVGCFGGSAKMGLCIMDFFCWGLLPQRTSSSVCYEVLTITGYGQSGMQEIGVCEWLKRCRDGNTKKHRV